MLEFGAHPSSDLPDRYIVHGRDIRALRAALSRPVPTAESEAVRAAFSAWQMGRYPKGDECERARIEWDKIGTPLARLSNGDVVSLEDEWEAWNAALRSLPIPASAEAVRDACAKACVRASDECPGTEDEIATWREAAMWCAAAIRSLPLPPAAPEGEVERPDEVPSAGAFREAFKNATLPRGADSASWAGGYCAGWTAAERAAKGGNRG